MSAMLYAELLARRLTRAGGARTEESHKLDVTQGHIHHVLLRQIDAVIKHFDTQCCTVCVSFSAVNTAMSCISQVGE